MKLLLMKIQFLRDSEKDAVQASSGELKRIHVSSGGRLDICEGNHP